MEAGGSGWQEGAQAALVHVRRWKLLIPLVLFALLSTTWLTAMAVMGYTTRSSSVEHRLLGRCAFSRDDVPEQPWEAALDNTGEAYSAETVLLEFLEAEREARLWADVLYRASLRTDPLSARELQELRACQQHPDFFHMYESPRCTELWVRLTRTAAVGSISNVLAVLTRAETALGMAADKTSQNGGFQMHFEEGAGTQRGYFKVCSGTKNSESHEKFAREIVAFHLDRILGFFRTPAVSMRSLDVEEMRSAALKVRDNESNLKAETAMDTIVAHCSNGRSMQGASVGWSPFALKLLQHQEETDYVDPLIQYGPKAIAGRMKTYYRITSDSEPWEKRHALESMTLLMFTTITGNVHKVGHNVFVAEKRQADEMAGVYNGTAFQESLYGPLVYIDNDRTSFGSPTLGHEPGVLCEPFNTPLLAICKFPKRIAMRILALSQHVSLTGQDSSVPCTDLTPPWLLHTCKKGTYSGSVGSLLMRSLEGYGMPEEGPMMECLDGFVLDENIQWWANHINMCIAKHGASDVLVEEPW